MSGFDRFTPSQRRAIRASLSAETDADLADAAGVTERTIRRWKRDREFQRALRAAGERALDSIVDQLTGEARASIKTLVEIRDDKGANEFARLQGAQAILTHLRKYKELRDLAHRVEHLETLINELSEK